MLKRVLVGMVAMIGGIAAAAAPDATTDATIFGARELVEQASLSPDGKTVAFVAAGPRGSSALLIGTPDTGLKQVLRASGSPDHLRRCQWASADRLVCTIAIITDQGRGPQTFTRLVTVNAAGGDLKMLSAEANDRSLGFAYNGGRIIDWLGEDGGGKVLMTRSFIPERTTGSRMASEKSGLGLERVDLRTLTRATVEQPNDSTIEYITDGHGVVRIRGVRTMDSAGYVGNTVNYYYRGKGEQLWKPLSQYSVTGRAGFDPYAVDRDQNVAYGFDRLNGRLALYKVALDGSGKRDLILSRPDVDVDGLLQIGRQHRVVGVSFATDKRVATFFDPELQALGAKLSKALPGLPIISFIDASDDESKLLLWAGSDVDPGRYFIYDKATRQLSELLSNRPGLSRAGLSPVKFVTYPAADGTMVPAYLTLPPGSDGKGLPAIVLPHGGPGARDEWGFDWLSQFFARRGYAVLQPNFRGSTGYGDAWLQKNGFQSWRTAIGDVTSGARWMVAQGIARQDQLGIVGWSYGGYAALQSAVAEPSLFKAVVAIAPVTDLATMRDDARYASNAAEMEAFFGKGPHIREGSPAQNAAKIKAPVLIFQGDLDQNVPIAQSRLMAEKLRSAGAKPQFIEYKGLDHQLDDSQARADMLAKTDAFLRAGLGL